METQLQKFQKWLNGFDGSAIQPTTLRINEKIQELLNEKYDCKLCDGKGTIEDCPKCIQCGKEY